MNSAFGIFGKQIVLSMSNVSKDLGKTVSDLIGNSEVLKKINLKNYITDSVGFPTLEDILKELEKPGLDIREKAKIFTFNQNIKSINDLHEGQLLPGIVKIPVVLQP